jgi:hypothetical protein
MIFGLGRLNWFYIVFTNENTIIGSGGRICVDVEWVVSVIGGAVGIKCVREIMVARGFSWSLRGVSRRKF